MSRGETSAAPRVRLAPYGSPLGWLPSGDTMVMPSRWAISAVSLIPTSPTSWAKTVLTEFSVASRRLMLP